MLFAARFGFSGWKLPFNQTSTLENSPSHTPERAGASSSGKERSATARAFPPKKRVKKTASEADETKTEEAQTIDLVMLSRVKVSLHYQLLG